MYAGQGPEESCPLSFPSTPTPNPTPGPWALPLPLPLWLSRLFFSLRKPFRPAYPPPGPSSLATSRREGCSLPRPLLRSR